jgi:hypothetical protein
VPNGRIVEVFDDAIRTKDSIILPWTTEGFDYFRKAAVDWFDAQTFKFGGLVFSLPKPPPDGNAETYLKSLSGWEEIRKDLEQVTQFYYLSKNKPVASAQIGDYTYFFVYETKWMDILQWFNSILTSYKDKIQSHVLKIFDCEKFCCSTEGNACQLVTKDETGLVHSTFLLPSADATLGAMFNYCTGIEMVGDFGGITYTEPFPMLVDAVQKGLKRLLKN